MAVLYNLIVLMWWSLEITAVKNLRVLKLSAPWVWLLKTFPYTDVLLLVSSLLVEFCHWHVYWKSSHFRICRVCSDSENIWIILQLLSHLAHKRTNEPINRVDHVVCPFDVVGDNIVELCAYMHCKCLHL